MVFKIFRLGGLTCGEYDLQNLGSRVQKENKSALVLEGLIDCLSHMPFFLGFFVVLP